MNTFRNIRKDAKALSPVVASIILIAVTVAVSVAVAAWMGGMTVGFMETEELKITNVVFSSTDNTVTMTVSNTGTTSVVISQVSIDNEVQTTVALTQADGSDPATAMTLPKNAKGYELTVTLTDDIVSGNSYAMKIVSTKGNYYAYNAIAP
jgi:archaeal type IV pilus assembly protein PilA